MDENYGDVFENKNFIGKPPLSIKIRKTKNEMNDFQTKEIHDKSIKINNKEFKKTNFDIDNLRLRRRPNKKVQQIQKNNKRIQ